MKKLFTLIFVIFCINMFAIKAFVLNSNSQTLTRYNFDNQEVTANFASLGQMASAAPNKMQIHNNIAYVVVTYENSIQRINIETGENLGYIQLEDSSSPNDIQIYNNFAYVTGNDRDKVYKINLATNEVVANVAVGRAPQGMLVHNNKLYVANTGFLPASYSYTDGTVSVINLQNFTVEETITVETNPNTLTFVNNTIHVVCTGNYGSILGKICVVNPNNNTIQATYSINGSPNTISIYNNKAYLSNGWPAGIWVYDVTNGNILSTPQTSIFGQAHVVNIFQNYLACIDAKDYIENSEIKIYNLNNNQLVHSFVAGVGATDIDFYSETTATEDNTNNLINNNIFISSFPNPSPKGFNFAIKSNKNIKGSLSIYNLKGQKIANVKNNHNSFSWNGKSFNGKKVTHGIYFYKFTSNGNKPISGKITVLK